MKMAAAGVPWLSDVISENGEFLALIGGSWKKSESGSTISSTKPQAMSEVASVVQACTASEIDFAFQSADAAQKKWRCVPLWKRAKVIKDAAGLLRSAADTIAPMLTAEVCKSLKSAKDEVVRTADLLEYTAEEAIRVLSAGEMITSDAFQGTGRTKLSLVQRVPLGVVVCVPPFNYPVNLAGSKIGPALASGNASLVKPPSAGAASTLSLCAAIYAALVAEFGADSDILPVITCITGRGRDIGDLLTTHSLAKATSFTGGSTGLSVAKKAGMIPMQMELGGKDPAIIAEDADIPLVVSSIVKGAFSYQGQRCTAVKVVFVHESIADEVIEKVAQGVAKLSVGRPEDNVDVAAVISKSSADWIESLYKDAIEKGAVAHALTPFKRDENLLYPVVLDQVPTTADIVFEEQFGPVLPLVRVKSVEEAIALANSGKYGLQACVFTKSAERAVMLADQLEAGTVQINAPPARGPDHFPFQGVKESGIGSQGVRYSIEAMTKIKSTVINLPKESYAIA